MYRSVHLHLYNIIIMSFQPLSCSAEDVSDSEVVVATAAAGSAVADDERFEAAFEVHCVLLTFAYACMYCT